MLSKLTVQKCALKHTFWCIWLVESHVIEINTCINKWSGQYRYIPMELSTTYMYMYMQTTYYLLGSPALARCNNSWRCCWRVFSSHLITAEKTCFNAALFCSFDPATCCLMRVQFSSPATAQSSGTSLRNVTISSKGRKPHNPSKSLSTTINSGLWLSSLYMSGALWWSSLAWGLVGWAWMDSALLMESTLNRKGSCPSNLLATFSPRAHRFAVNQSESSFPAYFGGRLICEGPRTWVPIHSWMKSIIVCRQAWKWKTNIYMYMYMSHTCLTCNANLHSEARHLRMYVCMYVCTCRWLWLDWDLHVYLSRQ